MASREHLAYVQKLIDQLINDSGISVETINLISATRGPGLIGSLLVGYTYAKTLAYQLKIPLMGINHLEGHIYAGIMNNTDLQFPFLALIISGGNTLLLKVRDHGCYKYLGQTRDDAAGEAIDKVGTMLNLSYPAGPSMEKLAREGNPGMFKFPVPNPPQFDFSYSGLKTAVLYKLREMNEKQIIKSRANIAAAFLDSLIRSLILKLDKACKQYNYTSILITGGVAVNSILQNKIRKKFTARGVKVFFPEPQWCGDNAAMIAYLGRLKYLRGESPDKLDQSADAQLKLDYC